MNQLPNNKLNFKNNSTIEQLSGLELNNNTKRNKSIPYNSAVTIKVPAEETSSLPIDTRSHFSIQNVPALPRTQAKLETFKHHCR